jgi:tetratricopeptide (TPR) repeat protein
MDSQSISVREAVEAVNQQASIEMKRGIALLDENTPASLSDAIGHFDRAIELRCGLPLDANPFFRHGLAAGWMNRGDALTRLGSPADLTAALQSHETALEVLHLLPLDQNPLFRRRLAIAWQNRGITLQAQGDFGEAAKSFAEAIAVLQNETAVAIADRNYLLAAAWMNQANAFVRGHESRRRHFAAGVLRK